MDYDYYFGDYSCTFDNDLDFIFFDDQTNDQNYPQDSNDIEKGEIALLNQYFAPINDTAVNNESIKKINLKNKNQNKKDKKHYTKKNIKLSSNAQNFKLNYYLVFAKKYNKFPKPMIRKIHDIIKEPLGLDPMNRDAQRVKDKYFEQHLQNSNRIIQYLVTHKEEILNQIPELANY